MKHFDIKKKIHIVLTILFLFAAQTFASKLGGLVADLFDYTMVDRDGTFMYISVHHIIQMIVALLIIFVLEKNKKWNFCLKARISRGGILYTIIFAVAIFIYVLISYIVGYAIGSIAPYNYELNVTNVLGTLGFQLLLSGTSEEILFRALPMTVLGRASDRDDKRNCAFVIVVAAVLFSVAHIQWTMLPLTISFSWFQLIYAFILGIAYGITYLKSKSVIYPMIMHGLSNFFMVGVGYIFMIVMN